MNRNYLKIKWFDCPKCKEKDSLETVVSGTMTNKRKEQLYTEKIIGYNCSNCNYQKPIEL